MSTNFPAPLLDPQEFIAQIKAINYVALDKLLFVVERRGMFAAKASIISSLSLIRSYAPCGRTKIFNVL